MDLVTHFDFYQTYSDKIARRLQNFESKKHLMKLIEDMSMLLIKMSLQHVDFQCYPASATVLAAFYAATAFLKHSKNHEVQATSPFCSEVRKVIFTILDEDQKAITNFQADKSFIMNLDESLKPSKATSAEQKSLLQQYARYFSKEQVEKIAMDLVDFFKIFDDWHCGLNQLKKFNKVPIWPNTPWNHLFRRIWPFPPRNGPFDEIQS